MNCLIVLDVERLRVVFILTGSKWEMDYLTMRSLE